MKIILDFLIQDAFHKEISVPEPLKTVQIKHLAPYPELDGSCVYAHKRHYYEVDIILRSYGSEYLRAALHAASACRPFLSQTFQTVKKHLADIKQQVGLEEGACEAHSYMCDLRKSILIRHRACWCMELEHSDESKIPSKFKMEYDFELEHAHLENVKTIHYWIDKTHDSLWRIARTTKTDNTFLSHVRGDNDIS